MGDGVMSSPDCPDDRRASHPNPSPITPSPQHPRFGGSPPRVLMAGCEGSGNVAGRQLGGLWGGFRHERSGRRISRRSFSAATSSTWRLRSSSAPRSRQIVNSLVENIITPIIARHRRSARLLSADLHHQQQRFRYGAFLNSLISFLIIALVVFFLIVKPMNMLMATVATPDAEEPELAICPECLREISPDANRCPNCTTWLRGPNVAVS